MNRLSDSELLDELQRRFNENQKALYDLGQLTKSLERVNKKLQESEALKSHFLSNIRNEIYNPLTSILGLSEQIMSSEESIDKEGVLSIAEMIHDEAFSLDYQLRNIFAAAELEAGETELYIASTDLNNIISSILKSFRHKAEQKKVSVHFTSIHSDDKDKSSSFSTDPKKLYLILSNLVSNAIEYSYDKGSIEVEASIQGKAFTVSVKDEGIGIDESNLEIIFDRFKQLDAGATKRHRGHGLGLCITKSLVEQLNGTISVSSKRGQGSTFTVEISENPIQKETDTFSIDGNEYIFEGEEF
jgi:signal transduction histidine kinase